MTADEKRPSWLPFLGWRIVAVAAVTSVLTGPGQTIGVSVFINPMLRDLGTTRSGISTAYLVGTLLGATMLPRFGRFIDRVGIRRSQVVVGLAFAVAIAHMASITNVFWLALGFAGIRMLGQGALSLIPGVAVSLWFERNRGLALGVLVTLASGAMALNPIALNAAIEATAWRMAWLLAAAVVAIVVIPIGWFGLIDRPSDVGLQPDGAVSVLAEGPLDSGSTTARSFTRSEAFRTRQFWILASIGMTSGMLSTGLNFHQIDLLGEAGLSPARAAAMFLPQIAGSSTTSIATGVAIDRIGGRFVPAVTMFVLAAVHLVASQLSDGSVVIVYAILLGCAGGTVHAALSALLPKYFGTDHIGSIKGTLGFANVFGSALGPVVLAVVSANTGSYRTANLLLMGIPIAVLLGCLTNRKTVIPPATSGFSGSATRDSADRDSAGTDSVEIGGAKSDGA